MSDRCAGSLPPNTPPTRPALHRNDPERDGVYTVNEPKYQTLPFPPPPFRVSLRYDVPDLALRSRGLDTKIPNVGSLPVISAPVMVAFTDQQGTEQQRIGRDQSDRQPMVPQPPEPACLHAAQPNVSLRSARVAS